MKGLREGTARRDCEKGLHEGVHEGYMKGSQLLLTSAIVARLAEGGSLRTRFSGIHVGKFVILRTVLAAVRLCSSGARGCQTQHSSSVRRVDNSARNCPSSLPSFLGAAFIASRKNFSCLKLKARY